MAGGQVTKSVTGRSIVLSIGDGAGTEVFTPIAQLKTASFSGSKWAMDDITNSSSPEVGSGVLKEQIVTVMDNGTLECSGVWSPSDAGQLALESSFNSGTPSNYKLQVAPGAGQTSVGNLYTFSAYVTSQPLPDLQFDKAATFKATLTIVSLIVVTPGH